jgi:hypothetical protein
MSRAGFVSLIAMMQGCFSPEGGDDDIVGCIEDAACKADRVCRDRQCVAADDDDDGSEEPDEVPPPDACEWNPDCASGCCKPALLDGDAAGWGECRPARGLLVRRRHRELRWRVALRRVCVMTTRARAVSGVAASLTAAALGAWALRLREDGRRGPC